jgi:hypothetical protein
MDAIIPAAGAFASLALIMWSSCDTRADYAGWVLAVGLLTFVATLILAIVLCPGALEISAS